MGFFQRLFSSAFVVVCAACCIATGARTSFARRYSCPGIYQEHLRLAKSLAIPAAVAIQNAWLYEQAEIFRAELEQRLADLEQAEKELREVQHGRELS